jgi:hypothetical protein
MVMNFFSKLTTTLLILATAAGCSSSTKKVEESNLPQANQNESLNNNSNTQTNNNQTPVTPEVPTTPSSSPNPPPESTNTPPVTQATAQLQGLADVPSPNKEIIQNLSNLAILGEPGEEVNLLEPISRGKYMNWLIKANNAIRPPAEHIRLAPAFNPGFTDINSSHPAYKYIQALASAGYSVGYPDKTVRPDAPLTREEMIGIKAALDAGSQNDPGHNRWNFSDRTHRFNNVNEPRSSMD